MKTVLIKILMLHDSPTCPVCNGLQDDAGHMMFLCSRFAIERSLSQTLGKEVSPESIVMKRLMSKEKWLTVSSKRKEE